MPRQGITVAIRARPTSQFAQEQIVIDEEKRSITVSTRHEEGNHESMLNNRRDRWDFSFDHVLFNASQETVFNTCARDIVEAAIDGVNGTIMAYGQTGSGKTFSMIGDTSNFKQRGVTPRILSKIFDTVEERAETKFDISCSYMEIYNERIFDLLEDISDEKKQRSFSIVEGKGGQGTFVRGLRREVITSEEQALNLLFEGELQRTTAKHLLNKRSNRSHCIFTIYIQQRSNLRGSENIRCSKINLVDLAGSERLKKTMGESGSALSDATTLRESNFINKSLSYLEQCVVALTSKSRTHVPYRQTKLTNVLKDSLGGNCKTLLLACIWAEARQVDETISTLQLASRMKRVQNKATVNVKTDEDLLLKKYERQIKELKTELMMHDALSERSGVVYDDFTPEKEMEIAEMVRRYVRASPADEDDVITIESVRHVKSIFRCFKREILKIATSSRTTAAIVASATPEPSTTMSAVSAEAEGTSKTEDATPETKNNAHAAVAVGEPVGGTGYSLGEASDNARPAHLDTRSWKGRGEDAEIKSPQKDATKLEASSKSPVASRANKEKAFGAFKMGSGKELSDAIKRVVAQIRDKKEASSVQKDLVSELSRNIRERQEELDAKSAARKASTSSSGDDVIDEEEYRLLKELRDLKRSYREKTAAYKSLRREILALKGERTETQKRLIDNFNIWFMDHDLSRNEDRDVLDYGEQFDRMEASRVMERDPDSLAFFKANKSMRGFKRNKRVALKNALQRKRT